MKIIKYIINIPKNISILLIKLYQKYISKLKSANSCRFYPTCSNYCIKAIEKYGFLIGTFKGIKRIIKCNPYCKGGVDYLK